MIQSKRNQMKNISYDLIPASFGTKFVTFPKHNLNEEWCLFDKSMLLYKGVTIPSVKYEI